MKSQHQFSNTPSADIPRSSFNLSHPWKTTFDADYLVPITRPIDIMPGDTFRWNTEFFLRLATPLYPIMDNLYFETFAFFTPYRLLWSNFEKFHGSQDNPADSIDFTIPVLGTTGTIATGDLADYFGLPLTFNAANDTASALPFRAYRMIYDEWFRDENMQNSKTFPIDDGPDTNAESGWADVPLKRGKRHDYFTACLPWPQKGTAVQLSLGTRAPISFDGAANGLDEVGIRNPADTVDWRLTASGTAVEVDTTPPDDQLYTNLSAATAATINDLRLAFQTQRLLERDARAGTRYIEVIKSHWGVTSPDFRLQRPEFLGGGSSRINITPVAQTSGQPIPAADDKLGNLAGFGTGSGSHSWAQSFTEHGVLIILGNVRADITYSQGMDRYWSKSTRYDFMYPVLSGIGEQAVLNQELWHQSVPGTAANQDQGVFGYIGRYDEYRYINGGLTGLFRVDAASNLAAWHLSEDFAALPTLNDAFIQANTSVPLDRALAIPSEPHIIADFFHQVTAARPMPLYGVPGMLDRL